MASSKITVEQTIVVEASPEEVWDYTQDWNRRAEWDPSVVHAEIVSEDPRVVHVRARGGGTFDVSYKLSERPTKTSLAMSRFSSFWLLPIFRWILRRTTEAMMARARRILETR